MTILPLVERELLVRARSPAGYWTRFAAALAGTLMCVGVMLGNANQIYMGSVAFDGLVWAAFLLCSCSGFLTVDRISRERREGTLGLLFLTHVRPLDVLLGSFGAAGIASLCALAAFVPVLMLPILAGGVSGGEAVRKVLALFDMMILSLAAGLWASARAREWRSSARSAIWVLVSLIFVPHLLETPFALATRSVYWFPGPLSALSTASDMAYRKSAAPYWISLAVVHAVWWLLMIGAASRLRRSLREEEEIRVPAPSRIQPQFEVEEPVFMLANFAIKRRVRDPRLREGRSPIEWLLRRQKGIKGVVWMGVFIPSAFNCLMIIWIAFRRGFGGGGLLGFNVASTVVQNCLFAWVASRFFIEARRSGELELLMTTPEGAETIVASQWTWLKKVFRRPLALLFFSWIMLLGIEQFYYFRSSGSPFIILQAFSLVDMLMGLVALVWAGMWFGWRAKSQTRAIVGATLLAHGIPYIIGMLASRIVNMFIPNRIYSNQFDAWYVALWCLPAMLNFLCYVWIIKFARRRLTAEVGQVAVGRWFENEKALYLRSILSYHD